MIPYSIRFLISCVVPGWAAFVYVGFSWVPVAAAAGLHEINPPHAAADDLPLAIVGGRLIDGRGGPPIEDAVVVIRGSTILTTGSSDATPIPEDAERFDATGMSILPGFIDAHFHSINDLDVPARFLRMGVTTFRDPGHPFRFYQAVLQTEELMPRVFLCGAHLDAYPPIWPQQAVIVKDATHARRAVNEHVDRGAAAIKIYFRLPLEFYAGICETARQRGVPVVAHLELIDADDAMRAGLEGIEHVTSLGTAIADPATAEAFKSSVADRPSSRTELRYRMWAEIDLDSARVDRVIGEAVRRNVTLSPTLAVFERRAGDRDVTEVHVKAFENMLRLVGRAHRAGVTIVAGSHTYVSHAELGNAFQRELELLVESGLTPMEAIQAGTLLNARYLGAEDRLGSVEAGKAADLVLVEGNPSVDIRACYQVRHVMLGGNWVPTVASP